MHYCCLCCICCCCICCCCCCCCICSFLRCWWMSCCCWNCWWTWLRNSSCDASPGIDSAGGRDTPRAAASVCARARRTSRDCWWPSAQMVSSGGAPNHLIRDPSTSKRRAACALIWYASICVSGCFPLIVSWCRCTPSTGYTSGIGCVGYTYIGGTGSSRVSCCSAAAEDRFLFFITAIYTGRRSVCAPLTCVLVIRESSAPLATLSHTKTTAQRHISTDFVGGYQGAGDPKNRNLHLGRLNVHVSATLL